MDSLDPRFWFALPEFTLRAIVDIAAVAFLIYQFFMIMRGRRAVAIVTGVLILVGVYAASVLTGLGLLRTFLETLAPYTVFALIVMFPIRYPPLSGPHRKTALVCGRPRLGQA